jgi:arsenate reductase (thioredoxin)
MYQKIRRLTQELTKQYKQIPQERKFILQRIATYIQEKYDKSEPIKLVFICTHNSRRSHFGQIAAALAADFYCIDRVEVYSGGTEATAFHPNAINALLNLGFTINSEDENMKNPRWNVHFGANKSTVCFSKTYDDKFNPQENFASIMTCSDAEQNCPFVSGSEFRIATTYIDPKKTDGTPLQNVTYQERFLQITTEMLYVFSRVK